MSSSSKNFLDSSERISEVHLCRLCMKNNDHCYNIFSSKVGSGITVRDALIDLIGLQVAVGDGLPLTMCPLCLKKLEEFTDFKKICFESDAELRRRLSRNYFRTIQGEGADGDKLGSPAETKESIQWANEGTSQLGSSVQSTEIYIPVPDWQCSQENIMCNVKEESDEHLGEGTYSVPCTPDPAIISREASDPLATDALVTALGDKNSFLGGTFPGQLGTYTQTFPSLDQMRTDDLFVNGEGEAEGISSANEQTSEDSGGTMALSSDASQREGSEYVPRLKRGKYKEVPLGVKIKVVNLAREHPNWSLATLRNQGSVLLKPKGMLQKWEKDIESGGTRLEKLRMIDEWVTDRFVEARQRGESVTTRTLQEWALSAAKQHISPTFSFTASSTWVKSFKKKLKIVERK
ncbi:uncharacterized protein LOC124172185 [Ischnura elegans]|uniref:uncharacterized protein LOC124172185 n=1 Tax=Ischnura elegans TaxID=197161 RepID=UPI001ED886B2|nr:uncharacterized protein LOC124172185 [Ischnura elegans]XP_046407560.1 uncharacterized protein LOC124172185 [Ischnura elegans]